MKKLIRSACVMIMMSFTVFEVCSVSEDLNSDVSPNDIKLEQISTFDDGEHICKMHISATPSTASRIAEIVISFCQAKGVNFKMLPIQSAGKYIVIYPKNDIEANDIAVAINNKFEEEGLPQEDFISVFGDI
ncbi:hypothetical protein FACS1894122_14090 [Alphaproteobacteria bacterium]|nr:hypothetical protein FACS1894122_14090 [Alphaproteobacteria bacterium]